MYTHYGSISMPNNKAIVKGTSAFKDTGGGNAHTKIKVSSKYGDIKIED